MTIFEEISIIANKLANDGKKPTVALIKNKLSTPTPLPTIINALKNWQHDPEFTQLHNKAGVVPDKQAENNENDIEQLIKQSVAQALEPIQRELAEIKALLQQAQK
mgnify:CR=1 FL=1